MIDQELPLKDRIDAAIERIKNGYGLMRVPAEATDPDLVLLACSHEIDLLRNTLADLLAQVESCDGTAQINTDQAVKVLGV